MHRLKEYWLTILDDEIKTTNTWWERKHKLFKERQADIVRINGSGRLFHSLRSKDNHNYQYLIHLSLLIKQNEMFYIEEQVIPYQFQIERGEIIEHREIVYPTQNEDKGTSQLFEGQIPQSRFVYDRFAAVQYAERWWNSYNPEFRKFNVDCTNFVSQCLYAGGIPMTGYPNRQKGWWYQNDNWSFSWSVSHSLRWHLSGSTAGLQGREVETAEQLNLGDVICYDFEGDGRYDHSTIVVAKDNYGQPLVNAHTDNSRHRYWSYEDSTAWTPNIKYKFFQIGEK